MKIYSILFGSLLFFFVACRDQEKNDSTEPDEQTGDTGIVKSSESPELEDTATVSNTVAEIPKDTVAESGKIKPAVEPDPNVFVSVEKEPEALNFDSVRKNIGYPAIARDAGIEGNTVLRILVDNKGSYIKHQVIKAVHPILTKEIEKHVSSLRFNPAIKEGVNISFWMNVPFNFRLLR